MTTAEIFYLAVVLTAFVVFSVSLAATSAVYERHKAARAAGR